MGEMNLTDWLFRNGYGYIYAEWLASGNIADPYKELWDWLEEEYPEIYQEYLASKDDR